MSYSSSSVSRVARLSRVSWLTIILGLFAVGTFIAVANSNMSYRGTMPYAEQMIGVQPSYEGMPPTISPIQDIQIAYPMPLQIYPVPMGGSGGYSTTTYGVSNADMQSAYPYPYPYPNPEISAVDTREFLKVRYDANMRTRDVPGLTHRVEEAVRGHEGRVDHAQSSQQAGYMSFVIPMSKYEAFRTEIEGMVGSRFLLVNVTSENLLPQKHSIEEQQKQADKSLGESKKNRQTIADNHIAELKKLQTQIEREATKLVSLRTQQPQTPEIQAQIEAVLDDVAALREAILYENNNYKNSIEYADANIKGAQEWQSAVKTQDKTLIDNIGTVSGSVSLQWISIWEIVMLYLPGYWIPSIFAVLAFLSYLWDRRKFEAWQSLSIKTEALI